MNRPAITLTLGTRAELRAVLVGDRIDTAGLDRGEVLSRTPLAYRAGKTGFAVVFRYGVVVLGNLDTQEAEEVLSSLRGRIAGPHKLREEETAIVETAPDDQIPAGGPIGVREMTLERLILVAYALSDSVVLAHDEREVSAVFDRIEPFARDLAERGRISVPRNTVRDLAERGRISVPRNTVLKLIGNALLAQHRLSGRVAVGEDPDILWDRPDLGRLYSRLKDEYELAERSEGLGNKLDVIGQTARALTDLMDSQRGLRLELMIVLLIVFEIGITLATIYFGGSH
jgi:uncharacterized Rmd1/YagE family protein